MINRVASVDELKGIRHKKSYWLVWTRMIPNGNTTGCIGSDMKIDGTHFLTLDRKAIRAKIAEYASKVEVGDDIELYVTYDYDDQEQLMTLTMQENGMQAIVDEPGTSLNMVPYIK